MLDQCSSRLLAGLAGRMKGFLGVGSIILKRIRMCRLALDVCLDRFFSYSFPSEHCCASQKHSEANVIVPPVLPRTSQFVLSIVDMDRLWQCMIPCGRQPRKAAA